MYIRHGISFRRLLRDSWRFLALAGLWSVLIVYLHEIRGNTFVAVPMAPVTIVGIAVSLYLGFKTTSAYSRWWEARKLLGDIIDQSRMWALNVPNLVHGQGGAVDPATQRELIDRHLAWVNAIVCMLRASSRLRDSHVTRVFDHRKVFADAEFHQHPDCYRRYLPEAEAAGIEAYPSPPLEIMRRQSERLGELARDGLLDSHRHVKLVSLTDGLLAAQGGCERLKNTPFPRQIARFGEFFTWAFIVFLPLGLVESFEAETRVEGMGVLLSHEYMFTMVPFAVLISWMFYLMEKVSDSVEDPFEGGVADVPVSSLCRGIEIDLGQIAGDSELPRPLEPVDGVLY